MEIDETGVAVYFQRHTFKVARFRVRRRVKESEVVDHDGRVPRSTADPSIGNWHTDRDGVRANVEEDAPTNPVPVDAGENVAPAQPPETKNSLTSPRLIPAPESPRRGEDLQTSPLQNDAGDPSASFDKKCVRSLAPTMEASQYDHPTFDELHFLCKSRGCCKEGATAELKTRLEAMVPGEQNSPQLQSGNMDTS